MSRNQLIVIASVAVLGVAIYLFADTKKPAGEQASSSEHQSNAQQSEPATESLNFEEYISDVDSRIPDKSTREKIEKYKSTGSYKDLVDAYQKLDKPLAVAYYIVLQAKSENKPGALLKAGDYNAMLMQTAPDEKAKSFLSKNALDCYKQAVALDSTNTEYRIRLAGAYMESGGPPMQGVAILLDIVRKDSNNIDALMMLGRFGIISAQYDKAISRLEKILYLQPQNSDALLLLAEAYLRQGDKSKAIEALERCKDVLSDLNAKKEIDNYIQSIKKPDFKI